MASKKTDMPEQTDKDKELYQKYIALFEIAWKDARQYFDKANEDSALYEQEPDLNSPTLSQISLAQAKLFVDQALPSLMANLFGSDNPFEFIPGNQKISYAQARRVRDWILYNMRTNMSLETEGYLTIKDAVKLGVGYGIVEPKWITPPATDDKIIFAGNEEIRVREMGVGETTTVPNYAHLPFGQVIPTPDGNTPEKASCTFVLRFYPEDMFRKMLDKRINPDTPFSGDVEKIIKYARVNSMDGYLRTPRQVAAQIANRSRLVSDMMNRGTVKDTPVSVPVLQCYAQNEHVWFACDKFVIYHKKDRFQTLRSPVVKATFDPEGRWFSRGIISPRRSMIMGVETFYNAIMDILTMHLHPHKVINEDAVVSKGGKTDLQPYGETRITGTHKTGDVISWIPPPPLPSFLLDVGTRLDDFQAQSAGQPKQLFGQGTPGLVRGGSGAMESLLQSSTGREKLVAKHFENGWYSSVVEQTLILCQMLADEEQMLPALQYDSTTRESKLGWTKITREDIRQVYRLELNFTEKMQNQLAEMQRTAMLYDRLIQNPNVDRNELVAMLVGNTRQYQRLTAGVDVEANIRQAQAMRGGGRGENVPRGTMGEGAPEQTITGGAGAAMGGLEI